MVRFFNGVSPRSSGPRLRCVGECPPTYYLIVLLLLFPASAMLLSLMHLPLLQHIYRCYLQCRINKDIITIINDIVNIFYEYFCM
jgi:hypothetical protein